MLLNVFVSSCCVTALLFGGAAAAHARAVSPEDSSGFVLVKLYAPEDGAKEFVGELLGFDDGAVTIRVGNAERRFEKQQIALTRLYAEF